MNAKPKPTAAPRERPILFSAPMIRALLDGRKSVTRRICKPQPDSHHWAGLPGYRHEVRVVATGDGCAAKSLHFRAPVSYERDEQRDGDQWIRCPYGAKGERLWVKESIRRDPIGSRSTYIADGAPTLADEWPWKNSALPSIHCPRGLSRITLEVTDVRVERLCDITDEDARAEGIDPALAEEHWPHWISPFSQLWDSINGDRAPWSANPWVWVVRFRRVT